MVTSLLERLDEITVDRKEVKDDRFNDLSICHDSRRVRRQFKASDNPGLAFRVADLATITNRKLTIDALVSGYTRVGDSISDETPRPQGGDLLVRPDIFVRITGMIEGEPVLFARCR